MKTKLSPRRPPTPILPYGSHATLALLLSALAACASTAPGPRQLRIVALNDFHGALYERPIPGDPSRAVGGLPWLASAMGHIREQWPDALVLDGGDSFQGSLPVNATQGQGAVEAFRLLGVEFASVGNHEFDYGPLSSGEGHPLRGALERAASQAPFGWLAANVWVRHPTDPSQPSRRWQPPGIRPTALIERNGVKIGLIGLSTTDTPQTTRAEHVADLIFEDVIDALRREIAPLRSAGAEVIVVLGHLTGACDEPAPFTPAAPCFPGGEIGRILTELPRGEVDVIVAGHAHRLMAFRWDDTFVVEAGSHGAALGRLELWVDGKRMDPNRSTLWPLWVLDHPVADPGCEPGATFSSAPLTVGEIPLVPSPEAIALVQSLESLSDNRCTVVGCVDQPLTRQRLRESTAGNVVADALLTAFEGAHFAVQNSGGLRADVPAGTLRLGHVHDLMPFDNRMVLVELSGADALELLRIGSSGAHGILQVSRGLQITLDPDATGGSDIDGDGTTSDWETDRLCAATLNGEPLKPEGKYRVVVSDFLISGGDHMGSTLGRGAVVRQGPAIRDVILDAARAASSQGQCLDMATAEDAPPPRIVASPACKARPAGERP